MLNRLIPTLRKIPALMQLDDNELRLLLDNVESSVSDYEENQTVISESDTNNNIYIILEGIVGLFVYNHAKKRQRSAGELLAGGIIGNKDLNNEVAQKYTGSICTLVKTTLFKIDRSLISGYLKLQKDSKHVQPNSTKKKPK